MGRVELGNGGFGVSGRWWLLAGSEVAGDGGVCPLECGKCVLCAALDDVLGTEEPSFQAGGGVPLYFGSDRFC